MDDAKNMMAAADPQPRLLPHGVPGATSAAAQANLWLCTVHGEWWVWVGTGGGGDRSMAMVGARVPWDEC